MTTLREELLRRAVFRCLRLSEALRRGHEGLASASAATALAGLSPASLVRLTADLFGRGRMHVDDALFDWEEEWFAGDLPAPPARLLIGGAGDGREVSPLAARGYEVVAFEPSRRLVERAARRFEGDPKVEFVEGSFEEMIDRRPGALRDALERRKPFDAIVFGWTSFTHVVEPEIREAALVRARELCPAGPALLSFWLRGEDDAPARLGRGARLGAALGRLSGRGRAREIGAGDSVVGHAGYCHAFTWAELEALAAAAGYAVSGSSRGCGEAYPHLTLRPPG